jgi:tryptophan synthase alpha chain
MSRIGKTFERLRTERQKALITYIMAGDPSLERTGEFVLTLEQSGADIIELGVPFSDPIADGPVIQRAGQRSLNEKTSLRDILKLVGDLRFNTEIPLVLMTYTNPVLKFGVDDFIREAISIGVDGVILPDLPLEEGKTIMSSAEKQGLDVILLAAPTTHRIRMAQIVRHTQGFLYYVSLTGITGASLQGLHEIKSRLTQIRQLTAKPIAVGFGISTPEQATSLAQVADGIVVGSAIVKLIEENMNHPELLATVGDFVKSLKRALRES